NTLTGTPRWSPDSKFIVCDSRPDGQPDIYVFPAEGGPFRRITSEAAEDVVPSWSRDGKWIYFASMRGGSWQGWKSPGEGGGAQQGKRRGGLAAVANADSLRNRDGSHRKFQAGILGILGHYLRWHLLYRPSGGCRPGPL